MKHESNLSLSRIFFCDSKWKMCLKMMFPFRKWSCWSPIMRYSWNGHNLPQSGILSVWQQQGNLSIHYRESNYFNWTVERLNGPAIFEEFADCNPVMIILLKNHLSDTSFHQLKQFSVLKNSQAFVELNQTPSNVKCKQPSNQIIRSVQSRRGGLWLCL